MASENAYLLEPYYDVEVCHLADQDVRKLRLSSNFVSRTEDSSINSAVAEKLVNVLEWIDASCVCTPYLQIAFPCRICNIARGLRNMPMFAHVCDCAGLYCFELCSSLRTLFPALRYQQAIDTL